MTIKMENNYTGWTLLDEVILVIKKNNDTLYKKYEYPQGYLVNPKDKKQLERAINWATFKKYLYNDNKESILDNDGKPLFEVMEPDIITVKNEGFTLEFLDSANESSQGGKLSFWNCLVSKDNLKFIIGIDSHLLLYALKQSTFINGKSSEQFSFARCSGGVGILHSNMKEYSDAIRDMRAKKDKSKRKTAKWQLGKNYTSLTLDSLLIAEIYKPIKIKVKYESYVSQDSYASITKEDNTKKLVAVDPESFTYKSFKEYINHCKLELNKVDIDNNNPRWHRHLFKALDKILTSYNRHDKAPSRQQGNVSIETYDNYYGDLQNLIDNIKLKIIHKLKSSSTKISLGLDNFDAIFINTYDGLSDIDKELLSLLINNSSTKINLDPEIKKEIIGE